MKTETNRVSALHPRMVALLLSAMCLVVGVIVGSFFFASPGVGAEQSFHHMMHEAMASMDKGMEKAPMTGDPDHDFASMMIPHHQGAIDMAKAELLYGKDPALRRLSQEIVVTQEQEIEVMRTRLKDLRTQ